MKKFISILLWVLVLSGITFYLISHADEIRRLFKVSATDISLLALLFIATQILNGFKIKILLEKISLRLKTLECFNLGNINTIMNYLPLKSGFLIAAFYLKNKHKLSYTNFANLNIASHIIQLIAVSLITTAFLLLYYLQTGIFLANFFYIFGLLSCVSLLITLLIKKFAKDIARMLSRWDKIKRAVEGLDIILSDRWFLIKLLGIDLLGTLVMGVRFIISFKLLSFDGPAILSFLAAGVKTIAVLIGVMPAGLGIAELFAGGVSEMMNAGVNIGLYAASLDRVVSVIVLVIIGSASFVYINKDKERLR